MAMHRNAEKFARRHLDRQAREEREEQGGSKKPNPSRIANKVCNVP